MLKLTLSECGVQFKPLEFDPKAEVPEGTEPGKAMLFVDPLSGITVEVPLPTLEACRKTAEYLAMSNDELKAKIAQMEAASRISIAGAHDLEGIARTFEESGPQANGR